MTPWHLAVDTVEVSDFGVQVTDRRFPNPTQLDLERLHVKLTGFHYPEKNPFPFEFQSAKKRPAGEARLPLMDWGKYGAHGNNRDAMGRMVKLTQNVDKPFIEWVPTIMHDRHEAATYLYSSTGTGPYNESIDAITVDEWWMLAKNDVMEMTKRGVPGVWTYGFYDGWTPNYMFYAGHTHNATGRFYEVNSFNPGTALTGPGREAALKGPAAAAGPTGAAGPAGAAGGRGAHNENAFENYNAK